jgi:hypothetical protein
MMTEKDYRVIQRVQFNITDLKTHYINIYGLPNKWTDNQVGIFIANCDLMIITNMEAYGMVIHERAIRKGLLPYIETIQGQIGKDYIREYGLAMDIDVSGEMYDKIDYHIYSYLVQGETLL